MPFTINWLDKYRWWIAGTLATLMMALVLLALLIWPRIDIDIPGNVQVVPVRLVPAVRYRANLQFDVGPNGTPFVATEGKLWVFGISKQQVIFGDETDCRIEGFAWTDEGGLFVHCHNSNIGTVMYVFGERGFDEKREVGRYLPSGPLRPAGPRAVYAYGGGEIYVVQRDGYATHLAEFKMPIDAVAGNGTETYIASNKTIYLITLSEVPQVPSVILTTKCAIVSLERAEDGAFYSTRCAVGYVNKNRESHEFLRGTGGHLRIRNGVLYVLLQSEQTLLLMSPVLGLSDRPLTSLRQDPKF